MSEEKKPGDEKQLGLYLEKGPDDDTLKDMRAITASPETSPFERDLDAKKLADLALKGEEMEQVLQSGNYRVREELKRRGAEKLGQVTGCNIYGRSQILDGRSMKNVHHGANEKESFYVGADVHIDGASVYEPNYNVSVSLFGKRIEREYPGYLVTWDGRYDHPVNLWIPVSAI